MSAADDPLAAYARKRDFAATPEPTPSSASQRTDGGAARDAPLFVIQKHAARSLHYDLRLEIAGTLKSWAVAKGPALRHEGAASCSANGRPPPRLRQL